MTPQSSKFIELIRYTFCSYKMCRAEHGRELLPYGDFEHEVITILTAMADLGSSEGRLLTPKLIMSKIRSNLLALQNLKQLRGSEHIPTPKLITSEIQSNLSTLQKLKVVEHFPSLQSIMLTIRSNLPMLQKLKGVERLKQVVSFYFDNPLNFDTGPLECSELFMKANELFPKNLIHMAKLEEHARRLEAYGHQLPKLNELVIKSVQKANYTLSNIAVLQKKTEDIIKNDISLLNDLMSYLSQHPQYQASIALQTNKNAITFDGALNMTRDHMADLSFKPLGATFVMNASNPVMLGGDDLGDIKGTSVPNFIQTTSLAILRALGVITSINNVSSLTDGGIYDVNQSPVIQTTQFPRNLDVTKINPALDSWFYFYKDYVSPGQGELLIPNLGYQFGGSRYDPRYGDKLFPSQDCSSILSDWVSAPQIFSTYDMQLAFNVTCLGYPPASCNSDPLCRTVLKVLTPICNGVLQKNVSAYDIFTVRHANGGGHTGIVTEAAPKCFIGLSDARDMPMIEGVGYKQFCPQDDITDNWFYFHYKAELSDSLVEAKGEHITYENESL